MEREKSVVGMGSELGWVFWRFKTVLFAFLSYLKSIISVNLTVGYRQAVAGLGKALGMSLAN